MTMTLYATPDVDPLNPVLYALLERKFGEVKIANAGAPTNITVMPDPLRPGRHIERVSNSGEYYCVNCPFCDDDRHRLWINHRYGSDFERNRRKYTYLAVCYNEDCLKKADGRFEQLETMVFGGGKPVFKKIAIKAPAAQCVHRAVAAPGEICSIGGLPDFHPAVKYVCSRNFDPAQLDSEFQIGVCTYAAEPAYRFMLNRIYIPITFHGELVGWQGRAVGDASGPKYYNCPGTSKSRMLYNYDRASQAPYVVVVEGVPSVWRIGEAAVCTFGKTMSLWQQTTLSTTWAGKPVILMLDHDAQVEMEHAAKLLADRGADVRMVYLPDARDPADYPREEVQKLISSVL